MKRQPRPATGAIIGRRPEQQDALRAERVASDDGEPGLLLVVADGMGGHAGGRVASAIAVDTFLSAYRMGGQLPAAERLRASLEIANRAIGVKIVERPELRGMGCTLVAALVFGDRVRWISVGDSLLMAIWNRQSIRLNADHSLAPEIDRAAMQGRISRAQADSDPDRHVLLSALNGASIDLIDEGHQRLGAGAFVLLATDGLLTLPASRIAELGSGPRSAEQKVAALLAAVTADMPADQDNTSLAAVHCGAPSKRGHGLRAGRTLLAIFLLGLASAGGGYAAWLLTRTDGPPPAGPADSNHRQPVPATNPYDSGPGRSGPDLRPAAPPGVVTGRQRSDRSRARRPAPTPPPPDTRGAARNAVQQSDAPPPPPTAPRNSNATAPRTTAPTANENRVSQPPAHPPRPKPGT